MNFTIHQPYASLSITFQPCHPEPSPAMSEAIHQTESKDPYHPDATRCDEKNFRIAVRFFDEHETEQCPVSSREAAFDSPARKCRISGRN
jgi:hypothetical protein